MTQGWERTPSSSLPVSHCITQDVRPWRKLRITREGHACGPCFPGPVFVPACGLLALPLFGVGSTSQRCFSPLGSSYFSPLFSWKAAK